MLFLLDRNFSMATTPAPAPPAPADAPAPMVVSGVFFPPFSSRSHYLFRNSHGEGVATRAMALTPSI